MLVELPESGKFWAAHRLSFGMEKLSISMVAFMTLGVKGARLPAYQARTMIAVSISDFLSGCF